MEKCFQAFAVGMMRYMAMGERLAETHFETRVYVGTCGVMSGFR